MSGAHLCATLPFGREGVWERKNERDSKRDRERPKEGERDSVGETDRPTDRERETENRVNCMMQVWVWGQSISQRGTFQVFSFLARNTETSNPMSWIRANRPSTMTKGARIYFWGNKSNHHHTLARHLFLILPTHMGLYRAPDMWHCFLTLFTSQLLDHYIGEIYLGCLLVPTHACLRARDVILIWRLYLPGVEPRISRS